MTNFKINKIYNQPAEKTLLNIPDGFIDLTITSPPYDELRSYNNSFNISIITKQLLRATKTGGVCIWVTADQTKNYSESGTSFKTALNFIEAGWCLYDTMIWRKKNYMPGNKHRYSDEFEYMFVFSKSKPKTFNPIKERCIKASEVQKWQVRGHESKVWSKENKPKYVKTAEYKIKGNVFEYATGFGGSTKDKIAFKHPAIFPEKLVADQINTWTNEGDLIYDCFMGSGTTAKVSIILNRKWLGSEISKDYIKIADERLMNYKNNLFTTCL